MKALESLSYQTQLSQVYSLFREQYLSQLDQMRHSKSSPNGENSKNIQALLNITFLYN